MLKKLITTLGLAAGIAATPAHAVDFSFAGNFTQDDQIAMFEFTVGATSLVTLRTLSYAGGINAAGTTVARGGFDPILALFDANGARLHENDDGGCGVVPGDAVTNACYDTALTRSLEAGKYFVSVMVYDNKSIGPNLSDGFTRTGTGNFTSTFNCVDNQASFNDVSGVAGCGRTGAWAFDVLNVSEATGPAVPEPATWGMMIMGFGAVGSSMRRRNRLAFASA